MKTLVISGNALRRMMRDTGLTLRHEYGDWCVPNLFYRVGRKQLLRLGVRLPLQPTLPLLGDGMARIRASLQRTQLPLHTGMSIGCIGQKNPHAVD